MRCIFNLRRTHRDCGLKLLDTSLEKGVGARSPHLGRTFVLNGQPAVVYDSEYPYQLNCANTTTLGEKFSRRRAHVTSICRGNRLRHEPITSAIDDNYGDLIGLRCILGSDLPSDILHASSTKTVYNQTHYLLQIKRSIPTHLPIQQIQRNVSI